MRYEAIPRNPVDGTARLRKPPSKTVALSSDTVQAIRAAVRSWRTGSGLSGPKPDGQLEAIIDVMLGTSARIGEALAIRRCDVDVTRTPATVRIAGTIIMPKGKPPYRQDHPKTSKSRRTVAVPSFAEPQACLALVRGPRERIVECRSTVSCASTVRSPKGSTGGPSAPSSER